MQGTEEPGVLEIILGCLTIPVIAAIWFFIHFKNKIQPEMRRQEFQRKAAGRHLEQLPERRRMIEELRNERAEWEQIAYVLNANGFRDYTGQEMTSERVKSEHAQMLAEKYASRRH